MNGLQGRIGMNWLASLRASELLASELLATALLATALLAGTAHAGAQGHEHARAPAAAKKVKRTELGISDAMDGQGRLWVVSKESTAAGDHVVVRHSSDEGKNWSAAQRVNVQPEPVAAPGEERPGILAVGNNRLYVVWTRPGSKNYAGDIRFAASTDGGASWSAPLTVHQDREPISHRHPVIGSDGDGRLYVVWIDRRDVERAKTKGEAHPGASLYYAVSDDGGKHWRGDFQISNASCDCCRLALQTGSDGVPVLFWREVFANSERDHALARLSPDGRGVNPTRATRDQWQVEACPDHGPALALSGNVRHAVWFDMVQQSGKVFYGRLDPVAGSGVPTGAAGVQTGVQAGAQAGVQAPALPGLPAGVRTLPDGAEHADIVASGDAVWVAWQRFDGQKNTIGAMSSQDGGQTWRETTLASSRGKVDQPRLLLAGKQALLVWNTAEQGLLVRKF